MDTLTLLDLLVRGKITRSLTKSYSILALLVRVYHHDAGL